MVALKQSLDFGRAGDPTRQDDERAYRGLRERVGALKAPRFWPAAPGKPALTALERAGLVRLVDAIPGACGEATMIAAMEAMRHAPRGDVVEIGAGWGRSAMLLLWLARRYQVGPLLCVDPWLNDTLVKGAPRADEALAIFEINLAPFADGGLNYLRARSADAARAYGEALTVTTEAFGTTVYQGQIAFLHIDGAHAEAEVARDCELWSPHVAPGGWIHFDDYGRAFGDGPRRVADAFVARESRRIAAQFQAGPGLFVQLKR
jgi:hypothetical protein